MTLKIPLFSFLLTHSFIHSFSNNWLDGAREDLVDMFIVHTMEEIQGLITAHDQFKATLGEADKEYNLIVGLVRDVEGLVNQYQIANGLENPYTTLTSRDLTAKWSDVKTLVPARDQTLAMELKKQQNNEMLRRQFAEKANNVGPWIEKQMDAVAAIGMAISGSLEEQLHRLKEYEQAVYAYKPHIEELEKIHQAVQESMIFENRYTNYTMETLRVGWEQLLTSINRNINEVRGGDVKKTYFKILRKFFFFFVRNRLKIKSSHVTRKVSHKSSSQNSVLASITLIRTVLVVWLPTNSSHAWCQLDIQLERIDKVNWTSSVF